MKVREGVIPAGLGTVLTAGIVGFGLAQIVLGAIDLAVHREDESLKRQIVALNEFS